MNLKNIRKLSGFESSFSLKRLFSEFGHSQVATMLEIYTQKIASKYICFSGDVSPENM